MRPQRRFDPSNFPARSRPKADDRRTSRGASNTPRQALARLACASHNFADPLYAIASWSALGLTVSDVPVRELLWEVHDLVAPLAAAGGVSLGVDLARAPYVVRGDRTALVRVLTSLAENAVILTPIGGRVSFSGLVVPGAVELCVADSGPGIPSAQLEALFDPLVQAQATYAFDRRGAGLGVGLLIARDLTRLMGGELFVRSAVGVGSLFAARFPIDERVPTQKAA